MQLQIDTPEFIPQAAQRLSKDLKKKAQLLSREEARFLVSNYYTMQDHRIRSAAQLRTLGDREPNEVLGWLLANSEQIEDDIKKALAAYAAKQPVGAWAMSICGIGPVIAAGLSAYLDIYKAPSVSHIWRYCGLNPHDKRVKGQKLVWNPEAKVLAWNIGESFVKVSNRPSDFYGRFYKERKELELKRNEAGLYADQAKAALAERNYGKDTKAYAAYSAGKLPLARIHLRAQRYATKLFLSHWHWVAYETTFGKKPPNPYIVEHGGHVHVIPPPNWPMKRKSRRR